MTTLLHTIPQEVTNDDIRYLKERLALATDDEGKRRLEKQIELLEDAVIVYCIIKD